MISHLLWTDVYHDPTSRGKGLTPKSDANTFHFDHDESVYCINLFLQQIPCQFELADYVIEIELLLAPLIDQDDLDDVEDPDAMS